MRSLGLFFYIYIMKTTTKFGLACLLVLVAMLCSCSKEWECTITTESDTYYNQHTITFEGTKEEKEAYEASGTKEISYPPATQTTVCK